MVAMNFMTVREIGV